MTIPSFLQSTETKAPAGERRASRTLYRFALYGRSGAGKTCVLAQMARGALGHRDGFECTKLAVPNGDAEAAGLYAGEEWIDQAVAALGRGESPRATRQIEAGETHQAIDFEISDPRRGATLVRMIDYSGELIDPRNERDPKSMANELKARLRTLDGLIVLADVSETRGDEFRMLREALASLPGESDFNREAVVVAFTKWDRASSQIQADDPEAEYVKLDEFLDTESARDHKALHDSIRNVAKGDGSRKIAFPTSAFREDPGRKPLGDSRPFGLLEPFLALADLRDEIDAEKVEAEFKAAGWRPGPLSTLAKRADDLLKRMPKPSRSKEAKRVEKARDAARERIVAARNRIAAALLCAIVFVISLCYCAVGYKINAWDFASLRGDVDAPTSDDEKLAGARERLVRYGPGRWASWLPFHPTFETVNELKDRIDADRDDIRWRPVEAAAGLAEKAEKAREYLGALPGGPHAVKANEFIQKSEATLALQREADLWRLVETTADLFEKGKRAQEYLQAHPGGPHTVKANEFVREYQVMLAQQREADLWRPVDTATDLAEKAEKAREYLQALPKGGHADKARKIVQDHETTIAERAVDSQLNEWEKQIQAASADGPRLLRILDELNAWNYTGGDKSKPGRRDALAAMCRERIAAKNWKDVTKLLDSGDVKGAGETWAPLADSDAQWKEHTPDLIGRIKSITEASIDEALRQSKFPEAERRLAEAHDGLAALQPQVAEHAPELNEALAAALREAGPEGEPSKRVKQAISAKNWKDVTQYLNSGDLKEAIETWAGVADGDVDWKTRTPELIDRIKSITEARIDELVFQNRFDEADQRLDETRDALRKDLEGPARTRDRELGDTVLAASREMDLGGRMRVGVALARDRKLYEEFRMDRSVDLADRYLAGGSERPMRESVEAYRNYLKARADVKTVKIMPSILWDLKGQDGRGGQTFALSVDGKARVKTDGLTSSRGNVSQANSFDLELRDGEFLSGSREFKVSIHEYGNLRRWSWWKVGAGSSTLRLADLEEGREIPIKSPSDESRVGLAILKIVSGVPKKPELPQWKAHSSSR